MPMREGTAKEFADASSRAGQVRRMGGKNYFTAVYSDRGTEVAEKNEILKRGKVVSTTYLVNTDYLSKATPNRRDTHYYADREGDDWGVFGDNSGFCYATYSDRRTAEKVAAEMNSGRRTLRNRRRSTSRRRARVSIRRNSRRRTSRRR